MSWGPIIGALAYFVVLILLANYYTHKKTQTLAGFMTGNRSVTWGLVALTLSLIPHGSGHTMSLWESSTVMGVAVYWWAIIAGGVFIPMLMLWFGPWVRQTGADTIAEVMEKLYGNKMRYVQGAINIASWTGITMSETIGIGAAIYALSGGMLPLFPWCIIIAFVLLVCYVIFGGVLELVWVSTINAIVMTVGSFLSLFFIGLWLTANAAGWDGVVQAYVSVDKAWMLDMYNFSPDIIYKIIIPVTVLHVTACSVAQGMYSPLLAAKTDADCRKGFYVTNMANIITAFPWVIMAIVAMSLPQFAGLPESGKLGIFALAMVALPKWLYGLLIVSLLAAVLSAGAGQVFGNATVLVNDFIKRALYPQMSDETQMKLMKPAIIFIALLAVVPAFFAPVLFPVFLWCFSFGIPVFVIFVYGLVWKTSRSAAWITLIASIIVNFWWTFATPDWATTSFWGLNMYPVTVVSFVLGTILFAVLPGGKGYLRQLADNKLLQEEINALSKSLQEEIKVGS